VIVAGGKTGAGLGVAQAAHAAGAAVVVASRRSFSEADHPELANFEQIALDVEDEDAVRGAFKAIGAPDHLIVAAGRAVGSWGAFSDTNMRGVRHYIDSKFLGAWACARYASEGIAADGSIRFE
jgi:NAD(P)-dependent dehydrogenase (short-subunit alcohol dehydrogenase family)